MRVDHPEAVPGDGAPAWRIPEPIADFLNAEPDRLKAFVQAAGIVGAGGAGFPAHVKLSPRRTSPSTPC